MKINQTRQLTDSAHLNLFQINYTDRLGNVKNWAIASRRSPPKIVNNAFGMPDAVVIAAFHTQKQKLVIIKEFRVALGGFQYGLPAGLVDKGESIADASRRELEEETGLQLVRIHRISPPLYTSSGMTDEAISMVIGEAQGEPSNKGNEASEDIETLFISPSEAAAICKDEQIKIDIKAWLVMSEFARTGSIFG